ncbi:hypothetical protein EDEG_04027 [Edhazardia aedis USNM 41457]|uniref:Uncharacterized protein n=1 Tax=Edhazardia aedis (strain USNM 41457) TaxID=1003232 RepID=J8ZNN9_EDHAE|nr:hypothetical protein EDEG_04027 [Edhazardia aedis USNM 41457]|eukprot:EJW01303.1 hypothetical protein EDEG_04027 [Edhazardia aedis USNM 41457]
MIISQIYRLLCFCNIFKKIEDNEDIKILLDTEILEIEKKNKYLVFEPLERLDNGMVYEDNESIHLNSGKNTENKAILKTLNSEVPVESSSGSKMRFCYDDKLNNYDQTNEYNINKYNSSLKIEENDYKKTINPMSFSICESINSESSDSSIDNNINKPFCTNSIANSKEPIYPDSFEDENVL